MTRLTLFLSLVLLPNIALAQNTTENAPVMRHDAHMMNMAHDDGSGSNEMMEGVTEPGQSAFAAIQQIVAKLMADPATDWRQVDIDALRQHLVDMDNVTLRANVVMENVEGGAIFKVTSGESTVTASIRAMVLAHAATIDGAEGWTLHASEIPNGASLAVTGKDATRIRALGFIGIMTVGMHHQSHHWAIALGQNPHSL